MTDQPEPEDTCRPVDIDGELIRLRSAAPLDSDGEAALADVLRTARRRMIDEQRKAFAKYPYRDGDVTVLGPEIFASPDGQVISWKGENYVPQDAPSSPTVIHNDSGGYPPALREQLHAAIEREIYEYREQTPLWGETEGITEEIARLATRAAMGVRDQEVERLRAELDRAHTELRQYTEGKSADAAAGSYAGRVEEVEQQRDQAVGALTEILAAFHPVRTADRRTVTGYTARITPADHTRWAGALEPAKEQ